MRAFVCEARTLPSTVAQGGLGTAVLEPLERIRTAELLLAPAAALFGLMLASNRQTIPELSRVVTRHWGPSVPTIDADGTAALEVELRNSADDVDTGHRWIQLAHALASGEFERALGLLMDQNRFVMKARAGAAPWVDVSNKRLEPPRWRVRQQAP